MQPTQAPFVAVVVVNWNLPELTLECLASLRAMGYKRLLLVLVDNGSQQASLEQLRRHAGDCVLLALPRNLGFAAAANIGARHALQQGAEYLFFMNNDALCAPDMLERLLAAAEGPARPGILAPLICYADPPTQIWHFGDRERRWLPIPRSLYRKAPAALAPAHVVEVDYVTGCGMLVRRELLERLGGFDERYTMYYEDADLCLRARRGGSRIQVVPGAQMWHKVSQSAQIDRPASAYLWMRSRVTFYRRKVGWPQRALVHAFLLLTGAGGILRALLQRKPRLALALLRGLAAGYRVALR